MPKLQDSFARRRRLVLAGGTPLLVLAGIAIWSDVADARSTGPDVTVISLGSTDNYGAEGGVRGYSVGTTSCNVGSQPIWWCNSTTAYCDDAQHPVIAQNMYRWKDNQFVQLGQSWLKHGFLSTNTPNAACGTGAAPPHGGDQLGVGLTDTYGSGLNGSRPLGKRSEVDSTQGTFPYPYTVAGTATVYDQRLVVKEGEVDPTQNPGARYFVEGHYVTADDAQAGNGGNNASYREVTVAAGTFNLTLVGSTIREKPALFAWKKLDPHVTFLVVDTPTFPPERFHAALKVTQTAPTAWHYEIALHNLDSDRAARSLAVSFHAATTISGAGFRDVDSHSGEPYSTTDWVISTDNGAGSIAWSTETFAANPNANALRWGTMYSFWFDADRPPAGVSTTVTLFKPGTPTSLDLDLFRLLHQDSFETGDKSYWSAATN